LEEAKLAAKRNSSDCVRSGNLRRALPLLAAFYISRERAFALERQHLADYADWTLQRGDLNISRARAALDLLASEQRQTCSPDDIARLQQVTTDALLVEEIAITSGGRMICNTWGLVRNEMRLSEKSIPLSDGYSLRLNGGGISTPSSGMVLVSHGDYHALLKQERLVDVLHDTPMLLGIASPWTDNRSFFPAVQTLNLSRGWSEKKRL